MAESEALTLAEALAAAAAAADDGALAALARDEAEAGCTGRLREAVALLRSGTVAGGGLALEAEALARVTRLVRRDEALEALYEAEVRSRPPETEGLDEVAAVLAAGAWQERAALDETIGAAASDWRVERFAAVDKAILRLALWELHHRPDLPAAVVVSEAVRLAKAYSTERSGSFVNGVLGRLVRERGEEG